MNPLATAFGTIAFGLVLISALLIYLLFKVYQENRRILRKNDHYPKPYKMETKLDEHERKIS